MRWLTGILLSLLALAVAITIFNIKKARAHGWYDADCCSTTDCFPVRPEAVLEIEGGWKYLPTGVEFKDKSRIRPSKDRNFHVCISNGRPLCIYILQGT